MSQIALDITNCKFIPNNTKQLENVMRSCASIIGATVVESSFHEFSPYGLSGVLVIAESHIAIHTYPEFNTVQIDMFTCGDMDFNKGVDFLKNYFNGDAHIQQIERKIGQPNIIKMNSKSNMKQTFKELSDSLFNLFSVK